MRPRLLFSVVVTAGLFAATSCGDTGDGGVLATRSDAATASTGTGTTGTDPTGTDPTGTGPTGTDPAGTDSPGPTTTEPSSESAFGWTDMTAGDDSIQTGQIKVPIDYNNPSGGDFSLYVARHKATHPADRIGTLLVDPGGPGFPGTDLAIYAAQNYSAYLVDHFDIIAWDPRGTGQSTPFIDCVDNYDKYFASTDITPDTDAEKQQIIDLAKEFETDCVTKNSAIIQHVGTNDSARDMDFMRQALGETKISYFGFSYGSELGATWATLFPDTVRAAVLDGASDPKADFVTSGLQQQKGFENSLDTFLKACDKQAACPFNSGGNAEGAFDKLMQALDDKPVPSETGRPDVTRGVAITAVSEAMYSQSSWPVLAQALFDAEGGDGKGLLALYDQYYQRQPDGTYDNSLEAFQVITCMDVTERPTVAEDDATAPQYTAVAPRLSPGTTGSYFCSFFPKSNDPRVEVTGAGAGPILVVGTTGDPATPLASSQNMAKDLEKGVLLTVVADQHTGYSVNQCSQDTVDHYLVELTVPAKDKRCG